MADQARESILGEQRLRLLDVGQALVAELDNERLLYRVLEVARELTGARYAALGVLDDRSERLERFLTVGIDEATHAAIGDLPRGNGILGVSEPHPRCGFARSASTRSPTGFRSTTRASYR